MAPTIRRVGHLAVLALALLGVPGLSVSIPLPNLSSSPLDQYSAAGNNNVRRFEASRVTTVDDSEEEKQRAMARQRMDNEELLRDDQYWRELRCLVHIQETLQPADKAREVAINQPELFEWVVTNCLVPNSESRFQMQRLVEKHSVQGRANARRRAILWALRGYNGFRAPPRPASIEDAFPEWWIDISPVLSLTSQRNSLLESIWNEMDFYNEMRNGIQTSANNIHLYDPRLPGSKSLGDAILGKLEEEAWVEMGTATTGQSPANQNPRTDAEAVAATGVEQGRGVYKKQKKRDDVQVVEVKPVPVPVQPVPVPVEPRQEEGRTRVPHEFVIATPEGAEPPTEEQMNQIHEQSHQQRQEFLKDFGEQLSKALGKALGHLLSGQDSGQTLQMLPVDIFLNKMEDAPGVQDPDAEDTVVEQIGHPGVVTSMDEVTDTLWKMEDAIRTYCPEDLDGFLNRKRVLLDHLRKEEQQVVVVTDELLEQPGVGEPQSHHPRGKAGVLAAAWAA